MKKIEIDGKELIIYEDGSIRIPHKDIHFCLDFTDIALLFNEAQKALIRRDNYSKDTDRKLRESASQ